MGSPTKTNNQIQSSEIQYLRSEVIRVFMDLKWAHKFLVTTFKFRTVSCKEHLPFQLNSHFWRRDIVTVLWFATKEKQEAANLAEFAFAKTSGTVTRDRETNWPIADRRFSSNDIRHNFGTHLGSTFLNVSWRIQVDITYAKCEANRVYYEGFENTTNIKRKTYGANWFPWSLFRHPRMLRQRVKQGYQW